MKNTKDEPYFTKYLTSSKLLKLQVIIDNILLFIINVVIICYYYYRNTGILIIIRYLIGPN